MKLLNIPLLAALTGVTQPTLAATANQLVYGETTTVDQFDPYTVHEASGQRLGDLIFDSLIEVGAGGNYEPSLAKAWSIEDGGASVIFDLRENVLWHATGNKATSGPELNANDVVTTIKLLLAPESEVPNRERFDVISSAEVLGPKKVKVHLNRAMIDPLRALLFKILPSHSLGAVPALKRNSSFAKHPIGTGPYRFSQANNQGEVLLTANDKYFKGAPAIKQIVMKPYADQSIMAQSLMFNSLDLITYVSPKDLNEINGDKHLGIIPYDALSFSFFAMNTSRGILKDRRVRQAISHTVNREEMLNAFFQGKGQLISGPFPPTSWAYNLDIKPMEFNPARSKDLLKEAGLSFNGQNQLLDKTGKPVKLLFAVPLAGESEMIKRIVLAFQGYLANVGIQIDLQFMDWLVWKNRVMRDHDYDLTIASWSFDDANNITSLFHSSSAKPWGNNFVLYRNPKVDSMLTEANATNDFDKKRAIYHKLHAVLYDEAPYTFLWTLTHHAAHTTRLSGVTIEPYAFFKHVVAWRMNGTKK